MLPIIFQREVICSDVILYNLRWMILLPNAVILDIFTSMNQTHNIAALFHAVRKQTISKD